MPRNTPRKQIVLLSKESDLLSTSMAMFIAQAGKVLTATQLEFLRLYLLLEEQKVKDKKIYSEPERQAKYEESVSRALQAVEGHIASIFLKAVREHDRQKIIEIADAVWFFKDGLSKHDVNADPERSEILMLKAITGNVPMSVNLAVSIIELRGRIKIEGKTEGYSAFRRKCKELGLPLEPSRKIRSKK